MKEEIINQILGSLNFGYIFCVNLITYLIIKFLEDCKKIKLVKVKRKYKISLAFVIGIIVGLCVFYIDSNTQPITIFYSFFFSLISFDYIFKPLMKRFKFDYKKEE